MHSRKTNPLHTGYSRVPRVNTQAAWVAEVDRVIIAAKSQLERLRDFVSHSPHSGKVAIGLVAVGWVVSRMREKDKGMSTQQKRRVFLSFAYEDIAQVNGLRGLIHNPNHELDAYDESVRELIDSQNADYIKRRIKEKIRRSSITVCLISTTTYQSKWVDWELDESIRQGNAIIAMALKGVGRATLPTLIHQRQIHFHAWDPSYLDRLIEAAR